MPPAVVLRPITFRDANAACRVMFTEALVKFPEVTAYCQYSLLLMLLTVVPSAVPEELALFAVICKTGPVPPVVGFIKVNGR